MQSRRYYMIMVSSITYAYKARDFLYKEGIKCYIERIPEHLRENGCGYGVKVENDVDIIAQMLRNNGINVKDIIKL